MLKKKTPVKKLDAARFIARDKLRKQRLHSHFFQTFKKGHALSTRLFVNPKSPPQPPTSPNLPNLSSKHLVLHQRFGRQRHWYFDDLSRTLHRNRHRHGMVHGRAWLGHRHVPGDAKKNPTATGWNRGEITNHQTAPTSSGVKNMKEPAVKSRTNWGEDTSSRKKSWKSGKGSSTVKWKWTIWQQGGMMLLHTALR